MVKSKKEQMMDSYRTFCNELAVRGMVGVEGLTAEEVLLVGKTYSSVISFLDTNNMAAGIGIEVFPISELKLRKSTAKQIWQRSVSKVCLIL